FFAGCIVRRPPQFFEVEAVQNPAMQVSFYLLVFSAFEGLQTRHGSHQPLLAGNYQLTVLNSDQALRFTSISFSVKRAASALNERAISVWFWCISGIPRSIAVDTAKYWLGIFHSSFTPAAASASASLKPGILRNRLSTSCTRSRPPVS